MFRICSFVILITPLRELQEDSGPWFKIMKNVDKRTAIQKFYPYIRNTPLKFKWFSLVKFRNERPHWFHDQIRINTVFPPYPSQAFDRIVDIIINKKRIPHTIDFAITSVCPYRCPHCSYGKRKKEDLSKNRILTLIDEIKELGTAILGITGGEPMIRSDLEEILSTCHPELATILYTTGYDFDKKRVRALRNAQVDSVIIGMDSADPAIQDKIKGTKGSLDAGINALKLCHEEGIYTAINTIATRERLNNGELQRIYDLACSLHVGEIRLNFPVATGRWAGSVHEQLNENELTMLKKFKHKLDKRRSGPRVTTLAEYESSDFTGCSTGYQTLFIDSSGEVCPCDFTPLSFGNIKDTPLKEIWRQMEAYFPRPRADCLMREIGDKIDSDVLPLPPSQSKEIIPKFKEDSPFPKIYKKLSNR